MFLFGDLVNQERLFTATEVFLAHTGALQVRLLLKFSVIKHKFHYYEMNMKTHK